MIVRVFVQIACSAQFVGTCLNAPKKERKDDKGRGGKEEEDTCCTEVD